MTMSAEEMTVTDEDAETRVVAQTRVVAMAASADPATRRRVLLGLLRAHARGDER
jgi:hypothetical protein